MADVNNHELLGEHEENPNVGGNLLIQDEGLNLADASADTSGD